MTAYEMRISDWSSDVCSSDLSQLELDEVWKYLNKKSLFVLQWGMRGKSASDQNPSELLEQRKKRLIKEKLFEPRAVYGYYRCTIGRASCRERVCQYV